MKAGISTVEGREGGVVRSAPCSSQSFMLVSSAARDTHDGEAGGASPAPFLGNGAGNGPFTWGWWAPRASVPSVSEVDD